MSFLEENDVVVYYSTFKQIKKLGKETSSFPSNT